MQAGISGKFRPQGFDGREQFSRVVAAAKPGLPGPGRGMEDRGYAIADSLPVAIDKRNIDWKIYPRARHHLSFKGVAVDIDNPRQNQKIARIERKDSASLLA
jgi:hypothetical protein